MGISLFGIAYDHQHLHHDVIDAFFRPAIAVEAAHHVLERVAALRGSEKGYHTWTMPGFHQLARQLAAAQSSVERSTRACRVFYVTEYGPLAAPAEVLGNDGRNLFERKLNDVIAAMGGFNQLEGRWRDAQNIENADERDASLRLLAFKYSRKAHTILESSPINNAKLTVALMWQQAEAATGLLQSFSSPLVFDLIVNGSWLFAQLGHLVRSADGGAHEQLRDGYPLAEYVPDSFHRPEG